MAVIVQPRFVVNAHSVDNQSVSVPFANGISVPRGIAVLRQRTSIREYLPVGMVGLKQHHQESRALNDFARSEVTIEIRHALREAWPTRPLFCIVSPVDECITVRQEWRIQEKALECAAVRAGI